jgi:hypothetical protein
MTQQKRIADNPSYRKLRNDIAGMRMLQRVMPVLKPILRRLGADVSSIDDAFRQLDTLEAKARELASLPDRFNEAFGTRGWIAYPELNKELMDSVVALATAGELDQAEDVLVEYYASEQLRFHLLLMKGVRAFRPREELALKALDDYMAERYHACVPIVLALVDGIVNDIAHHGFFAEGIDLTAWDSVVGHPTGLPQLAKVLGARRQETTTEQLQIPYRHGILHGIDLGYANKVTAAKAWAALFAIREWALKAERRELGEKPPPPRVGWRELFRKIQETEELKRELAAWRPRSLVADRDFPRSGVASDYMEGTPERALCDFLDAWKRRNYGAMAKAQSSFRYETRSLNAKAGEMRRHYENMELVSFEFHTIVDEAAAVAVIATRLVIIAGESRDKKSVDFRLVYGSEQGDPFARGRGGATWRVMNYLVW